MLPPKEEFPSKATPTPSPEPIPQIQPSRRCCVSEEAIPPTSVDSGETIPVTPQESHPWSKEVRKPGDFKEAPTDANAVRVNVDRAASLEEVEIPSTIFPKENKHRPTRRDCVSDHVVIASPPQFQE
jgi:hypothetical protein